MARAARSAPLCSASHAALCMSVALLATTPCLAASESADFELVFQATWSAGTHPQDFPPGPHFSGLIGGTHSARVVFWEVGGLASDGIEGMAETGAQEALASELRDAISEGRAGSLIKGGGIGRSPGSIRIEFRAHRDHPLLTLVSMVAPSPDWFVGVDRFALHDGNRWIDRASVDLHAYDAGTDSGATFVSPNANTAPRESIARIEGSPFESSAPLGSYTIVRVPEPERLILELAVLIVLGGITCRRSRSAP